MESGCGDCVEAVATDQAHVVNNLILQELLMATFVYITAFKK